MAKIAEYDATIAQDKITPTNTGYSATEMAARRLGMFAEQEAQGTREVGQLQAEATKSIGAATEAFLRFAALENRGGGVRVAGGGKVERTLLGTGSATPFTDMWNARADAQNISYDQLMEMHGGPSYLSRVARQATQNSLDKAQLAEQRYWDKINQEDMTRLNKGDDLGTDPAKEMRDISAEADEATRNPEMKQAPDYAGPGASFTTSPVTVESYAGPGTAPTSAGTETSSDITNAPSSGWLSGAWAAITGAQTGSTDSTVTQ